ncbi:hypothetical protein G7067_09310 [Leucobacter insecticola]|uniref:Uncharacterized protein n=1 Tax=Leucobacter insecticola TaxID=2714934 RepID=A0A6G8FJU0_9MICO|nr:hypothetical protein [Leucobacter insecticola]QIM16563.1 hypothetical protein G7067_09310 [Leucobacter insecticola]
MNLVNSAYPAKLGYRITFYELGQDEEHGVQLRPLVSRGRSHRPSTHAQGNEAFDGMMELLNGSIESTSKSDVRGHDYTSYAQAAVSRGDALYGVISIDTNAEIALSESDEANLTPIADVLAAFFFAADPGNRDQAPEFYSEVQH